MGDGERVFAGEVAVKAETWERRQPSPQVRMRQRLAGARGQRGERWTRAGMAMSRPAATPGRMFFHPVLDTWRA